MLGWQELGQATDAPSVAWIRSYDGWSSDLAAQRLQEVVKKFLPESYLMAFLRGRTYQLPGKRVEMPARRKRRLAAFLILGSSPVLSSNGFWKHQLV